MPDYAEFDAADYLDNDETVAEFLAVAAEDPDPAVFLAAVAAVARARDDQGGVGSRPWTGHLAQGADAWRSPSI